MLKLIAFALFSAVACHNNAYPLVFNRGGDHYVSIPSTYPVPPRSPLLPVGGNIGGIGSLPILPRLSIGGNVANAQSISIVGGDLSQLSDNKDVKCKLCFCCTSKTKPCPCPCSSCPPKPTPCSTPSGCNPNPPAPTCCRPGVPPTGCQKCETTTVGYVRPPPATPGYVVPPQYPTATTPSYPVPPAPKYPTAPSTGYAVAPSNEYPVAPEYPTVPNGRFPGSVYNPFGGKNTGDIDIDGPDSVSVGRNVGKPGQRYPGNTPNGGPNVFPNGGRYPNGNGDSYNNGNGPSGTGSNQQGEGSSHNFPGSSNGGEGGPYEPYGPSGPNGEYAVPQRPQGPRTPGFPDFPSTCSCNAKIESARVCATCCDGQQICQTISATQLEAWRVRFGSLTAQQSCEAAAAVGLELSCGNRGPVFPSTTQPTIPGYPVGTTSPSIPLIPTIPSGPVDAYVPQPVTGVPPFPAGQDRYITQNSSAGGLTIAAFVASILALVVAGGVAIF